MSDAVSSKERLKVALVTNMLPPYRLAFYERLASVVDLTVILDTLSEFNRQWQVDPADLSFRLDVQNCRSFVYRRNRRDVHYAERRQFHFSEKTYGALKRVRPEVIIAAEFGCRTIWSLLYGKLNRVPVIIASEGTLHTEGHVGWIKRQVRLSIVARLKGAWSNGPESSALLESYGMPAGRISEGMTGIDTEDFRHAIGKARGERDAVREELGLRGRVLLFSGTFTDRKGLVELLRAAGDALAAGGCPPFSLLLLGDGPHEEDVRRWAEDHPEVPVVTPGFVQHDELPRYFAAADWAVLPTLDDNWPLATLETLVAGLPQLFSIYNGATSDLCRKETGIRHDPLDRENFRDRLMEALNSPLERVPEEQVEEFSTYYSAKAQAERALISLEAAARQ